MCFPVLLPKGQNPSGAEKQRSALDRAFFAGLRPHTPDVSPMIFPQPV